METTRPPDIDPGARPAAGPPPEEPDGRSDLRVVLQFFLVPLSLVVVLVALFFGLQLLRRHRPDPRATLRHLERYEGLLRRYVGDFKRWQSGYDLSLLLRSEDAAELRRIVPDLAAAFETAGARGDLRLRRYLALALGHAADPRGAGPLRDGLRDPDPPTRLFSAWGLLQIGSDEVLPDLRLAAADPDPGVRKLAVFGLGRLRDRGAAGLLRARLEDDAADVRWNAALSLAQLGDEAAAPVLIRLLEESMRAPAADGAPPPSDDGTPRAERALNAIRGLALLDAPAGREALERAAGSADPAIAAAARAALAPRAASGS